MKFINFLIGFVLVLFVVSCEDVIDVDLAAGDNQLLVDAWITDQPQTQVIRLRRTSPYFDSTPSPTELGAEVNISDGQGANFIFVDSNNDGNYTWNPEPGEHFGNIGNSYKLEITLENGVKYESSSQMNRIMPIDSIAVVFEEESLGQPEGFYCEFFAIDPPGAGDAYWIKTFKNGQFLNKPGELNIAFDAGFSAGAMLDGITFITPIRTFINRSPDSGDDAVDDSSVPPYAEGDSINVQVHSLTFEAFEFLQQAQTQMNLGDAGIFAEPPSNVPSNILVLNSSEAKDQPVGFFSVSAVSALGRMIE